MSHPWSQTDLAEAEDRLHRMGQAWGYMTKAGGTPVAAPSLAGRLIASRSGWMLLEVPNAVVRGLFTALHEPGIELPLKDGVLTAHISVMTEDEVIALGGPQTITERGQTFHYQLGPLKSVEPSGWKDVSRCWFVEIQSPELKQLRKSYGLTPLPRGDHEFHCTVAVRRKHVLRPGEIRKAAHADRIPGTPSPTPSDPASSDRRSPQLHPPAAAGGEPRQPDPAGDPDRDGQRVLEHDDAVGLGTVDDRASALGGDSDDRGRGRAYDGGGHGSPAAVSPGLAALLGGRDGGAGQSPRDRDPAARSGAAPADPGCDVLIAKVAAATSLGAEAETARIHANRLQPQNQKPHPFREAGWTHPNGHPRCLRCGGEPRGDGTGPPYDLCQGYNPDHDKPARAKAQATRARRITKHDNRVAREHNPRIRAFGRKHGLDVSDILLAIKQAACESSPVDEHGDPCPDGECCPHCRARLEREPHDGTCNRCGKRWGPRLYRDKNATLLTIDDLNEASRLLSDDSVLDALTRRSLGGEAMLQRQAERGILPVPTVPTAQPVMPGSVTDDAIGLEMTDPQDNLLGFNDDAIEKEGEANPVLEQLRKAKAESDRRNFAAKHAILRPLLEQYPGEFVIDSQQHRFAGLTHSPTGFRIHMPRTAVPGTIKAAAPIPLAARIDAVMPRRRRRPVALPAAMAPVLPVDDEAELAAQMPLALQMLARPRRARRRRAAVSKLAAAKEDRHGALAALKPGAPLDFVVQQHDADQAGTHHDVRIGNPELGMFSWAAPKGLPKPGEKRLAVMQPTHPHSYNGFEGAIRSGYGKGQVRQHLAGKATPSRVEPGRLTFEAETPDGPQRFAMLRQEKWGPDNWLMLNTTKAASDEREHNNSIRDPAASGNGGLNGETSDRLHAAGPENRPAASRDAGVAEAGGDRRVAGKLPGHGLAGLRRVPADPEAITRVTKTAAISVDAAMPLAGAAVGGLGGLAVNKLFGFKRPWTAAAIGAGLGGLRGANLAMRSPVESLDSRSLSREIAPFYANAPGGYAGAVGRAIANRKPIDGMFPLQFNRGDLDRQVPIIQYRDGIPGQPYSLAGATIGGGSQPARVELAKGGTQDAADLTRRHELSHAGLDMNPASRTGELPQPSASLIGGAPADAHRVYAQSASELIPRISEIKRQFVAAHPGTDVDSEAVANEALEWYGRQMSDPASAAGLGGESAISDWQALEKAKPGWLRSMILKLMPQLVDTARTGTDKTAAMLGDVELQPQQKRVADQDNDLLVYHGLGSGKTLAAIAAAEKGGGPYLAVTPAALRPNFQKEREKWTDMQTPATTLSYTQVAGGHIPDHAYDTFIADEAHRLRNPDSQQSKNVAALAAQARRRILLSGSPIVNAPSDLAMPMAMVTGRSMTPDQFDQQFIGKEYVNPGLWARLWGVKPTSRPTIKNEDELEDLWRGHVDYYAPDKPLVDSQTERIETDLGPDQQDFYKLMWGKLPWMTRWKLSRNYPLSKTEVKNLSSFMTGPRQAGLSLLPFMAEGSDPLEAFKGSPKLQRAMSELDKEFQNPQAKALIFSNFIDAGLTPYAAALAAKGIPHGVFKGGISDAERTQMVNDYNSGKLRALLLGPSGSEGISTRRTSLIQQLDPHFNEAREAQNKGRGIRLDSHTDLPPELRNVRVQRFISRMPEGFLENLLGRNKPSADEVLERMSADKERLNDQFRRVLQRVGTPSRAAGWFG